MNKNMIKSLCYNMFIAGKNDMPKYNFEDFFEVEYTNKLNSEKADE